MSNNFNITYWLMVIVQLIIYGCLATPCFINLTILPALFLFLPIRTGKIQALVLSFVTGLIVDLLGDGVLGLNILSLVFLAYFRDLLIVLIFGRGVFSRKEDISVKRQGFGRICIAIILFQLIFLSVYMLADSAGTRSLDFIIFRLGASILASFAASIPVAFVLSSSSSK